jgi:hypothetical protein
MSTFTPPVGLGQARGDHDSSSPSERLFSFYSPIPTGVTVWQDRNGVWHEEQYPYHGGDTSTVHDGITTTVDPVPPVSGLANAQRVYQGGHIYDISAADVAALTAAGYASRINIAPVNGTWTSEQLLKFDSKMLMTANAPNATGPPYIDGNALRISLATGTAPGQSQLREFFLHSDTSGWTDTHGIVEIDPPAYGTDVGGGQFIIPQMGVSLRSQFNPVTGKNQGITLDNGTIFALPILNIGAWHAFPDGSGFANRQFSWPLFESFPLPYGWEYFLVGNIIRVRIFPLGQDPDSTPWNHPTHARILNLDTDCGSTATVPTPVGPGTNGIVSAHLGTDPRCATRIRRFFMERTL